MAGSHESSNIIAGSLRRVWRNAGAPSNGTSGTYANIADAGDLLIDTTNKKLYQNTNTQASPTWGTVITSLGGTITDAVTFNSPSATDGIILSSAGWTAGLNNAAIRFGTYTTPQDMDTSGGHKFPMIISVGVDNAASNTWGCAIFKAVTGVAQTSADVIPILGRLEVDHSVANARAMQWFTTVGASGVDVSGQLSGGDFKVDVGSSNSLTGSVYGIQVILDGSATKSTSNDTRLGYFALYANAQADSIIFAQAASGTTVSDLFYGACHNGCTNGLCLNAAGGTMVNGIKLMGTMTNAIIVGSQTICDGSGNLASANGVSGSGGTVTVVDGIVTAVS